MKIENHIIFLQHIPSEFLKIMLNIVLIYIALVILIYLERKVFKRIITQYDRHLSDKTNLIFIRNIVVYSTYCMAIFLMISQIPGMKQLSNTLLAGAGILVAAIGFGSQQAISNIVSGIFMVIFKPFHVGDNIILSGDTRGTVIDISLRHTTIKNNENNVIIIPNTVLNNQSIVNFSAIEVNSCAHVEVSISYSANIDKAIQLIQEEALKHRFLIDKRSEADKENGAPQVIVRVLELTKLSVDLRAWAWAENYVNAFILKCELLKSIKERFDKEGIELAMINPTKVHFSEVE